MKDGSRERTIDAPTVSVIVDWTPVGPDAWEAEWDGFTLRVEALANPDDLYGYRWTAHYDGALVCSAMSERLEQAMYRALAYLGHPHTLSDAEVAEYAGRAVPREPPENRDAEIERLIDEEGR